MILSFFTGQQYKIVYLCELNNRRCNDDNSENLYEIIKGIE